MLGTGISFGPPYFFSGPSRVTICSGVVKRSFDRLATLSLSKDSTKTKRPLTAAPQSKFI